ncbi:hypothetical protein PsYK624_053870 [Phanerochaete sordida]|uniref:Uncharacterized protein n=1 Tax=Phanerochaete sordida TaxID=48140 RepID=A0A9P3LBK2_9APHY|nr:hypothetical protein PsYK624_053870 [Phanerochaete sordida]
MLQREFQRLDSHPLLLATVVLWLELLANMSTTLLFIRGLGLLFISSFLTPVFGRLINVTVDDQGADPTTGTVINYEAMWAIGPCSSCGAKPDANNALDGTWHDTTYNPDIPAETLLRNATFNFTGSALYVFGMIDGGFGIDLIFYMDEEVVGRFVDPQTSEFTYKYNQVYFSAENLESKPHSFKLQNGEIGGPRSVVLFDYLIYTKDDEDSSSTTVPAVESVLSPAPSIDSTASQQHSPTPEMTSPNTSSSGPAPTPASAKSSHGTGLSGTSRTAVIAVAIVVPLIIIALLVLLYRARRSRYRPGARITDLCASPRMDPDSPGHFAHFADAETSQHPSHADAAPTNYAVSAFTPAFASSGQASPGISEKSRTHLYVASLGLSAHMSPSGSGVEDDGLSGSASGNLLSSYRLKYTCSQIKRMRAMVTGK